MARFAGAFGGNKEWSYTDEIFIATEYFCFGCLYLSQLAHYVEDDLRYAFLW